jgi:hypothetical protein
MKIYMILADSAQEVNGKLFILGGGWDIASSPIPSMSVAIKAEVPWTSTGKKLEWSLRLINEDGINIIDDAGNPIGTTGNVEVNRPDGHPEGAPISFPMALNINNLILKSGRYEWQLDIDGYRETATFVIREPV